MEEPFLQSLRDSPDDLHLRLVFADWLEEHGDRRGELLRLTATLTQATNLLNRAALEEQLHANLAANVKPIGPFWTNPIGMMFAWIPPGVFQMGSPSEEPERHESEIAHAVTLTRGFFIGVHPVTQGQWRTVMGTNPSRFKDDNRPVECVSWDDCQDFCAKLIHRSGLADEAVSPYRLPTEAEWEYACRGGTSSPYHFGSALSTAAANYHAHFAGAAEPKAKYRQETTPVGSFPANAWGVHDMHGNVFEWCADWYRDYSPRAASDPAGQPEGNAKVLRGGSWHSLVTRCRSASRGWGAPGYRGSDVGVRLCYRLDSYYVI